MKTEPFARIIVIRLALEPMRMKHTKLTSEVRRNTTQIKYVLASSSSAATMEDRVLYYSIVLEEVAISGTSLLFERQELWENVIPDSCPNRRHLRCCTPENVWD